MAELIVMILFFLVLVILWRAFVAVVDHVDRKRGSN